MTKVPIAQLPGLRDGFPWSRWALALGLVALLALGGFLLWRYLWPLRPAPSLWVEVALAAGVPPGSVKTISNHRLHLVHLEDGELLAFYWKSPHLGERIVWRPDFLFEGKQGWFRSPSHGETFDMAGRCVQGPCPRGLDRFPVKVEKGRVLVNTGRLIEGPPLTSPP